MVALAKLRNVDNLRRVLILDRRLGWLLAQAAPHSMRENSSYKGKTHGCQKDLHAQGKGQEWRTLTLADLNPLKIWKVSGERKWSQFYSGNIPDLVCLPVLYNYLYFDIFWLFLIILWVILYLDVFKLHLMQSTAVTGHEGSRQSCLFHGNFFQLIARKLLLRSWKQRLPRRSKNA